MAPLKQLRIVAFLEGVSFVVLLFVAMPLKYLAGHPLPVRIVGAVHGMLFLMFVAALFRAAMDRDWSFRRSAAAFASSLVPFGTFVLDGHLRRELAGPPRD